MEMANLEWLARSPKKESGQTENPAGPDAKWNPAKVLKETVFESQD